MFSIYQILIISGFFWVRLQIKNLKIIVHNRGFIFCINNQKRYYIHLVYISISLEKCSGSIK